MPPTRFSIFVVLVFVCFIGSSAFSKGAKPTSTYWTGYLVDLGCARERKDKESDFGQKHTKKCMQMPICDRSGFGLLMAGNELLAFDEAGNGKVRRLLKQTNQSADLRVVVQGRKSNAILQVNRIELVKH